MKGSIPALIQESLQDSEGGRERCPHSALSPSGLRNCSLGSNQGFPVKGEPGGQESHATPPLPSPLRSRAQHGVQVTLALRAGARSLWKDVLRILPVSS